MGKHRTLGLFGFNLQLLLAACIPWEWDSGSHIFSPLLPLSSVDGRQHPTESSCKEWDAVSLDSGEVSTVQWRVVLWKVENPLHISVWTLQEFSKVLLLGLKIGSLPLGRAPLKLELKPGSDSPPCSMGVHQLHWKGAVLLKERLPLTGDVACRSPGILTQTTQWRAFLAVRNPIAWVARH